jgi:hypothetical protein
VIRVGAPENHPGRAAPAYAIAFVDLRFTDGHVERWLGAGEIRDEDLVPYDELVDWGTEVAIEHPLIGDLGMAFSNVDPAALDGATLEVVIEWNAALPELT